MTRDEFLGAISKGGVECEFGTIVAESVRLCIDFDEETYYIPYSFMEKIEEFITVNGIKVPKPIQESDEEPEAIYVPSFYNNSYFLKTTDIHGYQGLVKNGVAHRTPEAAAKHAKALLGLKDD